jgi:aminopeptidase YwaD
MKKLALAIIAVVSIPLLFTQEREDRTLLSWKQMTAIINEVSGERAMHHVLELVPYPRVRTRAEYQGHFRESDVMAQLAREYGYQKVEIESFPSGPSWHASQAELWMIEPQERKLCDINDIAVSVCSGSATGDVTADLIDVGNGARSQDYAGKEVKGKVVLGYAAAGALYRQAVTERGAVGVLSFSSLRLDVGPTQVLSQSISARGEPQEKSNGFGWSIAPAMAQELARRLGQGETVKLRSVIKSETFPGEMEVVHAAIPGDGSSEQAVAVSAHLYEGYIKQGANDDNSGCAMTLEMGRAFMRLVQEGKLPRPKRDIHFLWVPEISGTMAWLNKHQDLTKRMIADLNFDMEGLGLSTGSSQWVMHRTPDTFPTFLNDLCANVLEFIGELNRERVRYRNVGYQFSLPVMAPNGSRDPFYYIIDKFYGASDHVVYMNQGVPSVMFVTWPDPYYHSSQDTPDKLDSTMFKRAAVVGAAAMTFLAVADDVMAAKVTAEALARGAERVGAAERKGLSYLADCDKPDVLAAAYREARNAIQHQSVIEKGVLASSAVLYKDPAEAQKRLEGMEPLVDQRAAALLNEAKVFYEIKAQQHGIQPVEPMLTELESKALRTIAERPGGQQGGFGGFGFRQAMERLSAEERIAMSKVPSHMTSELNILLGRKKTVMEIRNFLSGEFEPLELPDLMDYLRLQEKMGSLKFSEKPEEPKPIPPSKPAKEKKRAIPGTGYATPE